MHVKEIIKAGIRRKPKRYSPIGPWQLSLSDGQKRLQCTILGRFLWYQRKPQDPFLLSSNTLPGHFLTVTRLTLLALDISFVYLFPKSFYLFSISNSILASNFSCESRTNYIILRNGVFLYLKGKKVTGCSMNHQVCLFSVLAVE